MGRMSWWRLRGRGALPLSFLVCAGLALAAAILGRAQSPIIDRARAEISDFTAPVLGMTREPLLGFERWMDSIRDYFVVYHQNRSLRAENAELRKWQIVALSLEDKVRHYEKLLNVAPGRAGKKITARVIGESNRPFVSTLILNAGAKDGVRKGQAVSDENGMIGRIYLTGGDTSWVILLTDLNSRVPIAVEPSHRRGMLIGNNTALPSLELEGDDGDVHTGERILTSGDGGLLPPDLPVGTVMKTSDGYLAALYASAGASDFVQVLDNGEAIGIPVASAADVVARRPEPMQDFAAERREPQRDTGPQRRLLPEDAPETADGQDR